MSDLVADGSTLESSSLLRLLRAALRHDQEQPEQGEHRDENDQAVPRILLWAAGEPGERGGRVGLELAAFDRRPRARGQFE